MNKRTFIQAIIGIFITIGTSLGLVRPAPKPPREMWVYRLSGDPDYWYYAASPEDALACARQEWGEDEWRDYQDFNIDPIAAAPLTKEEMAHWKVRIESDLTPEETGFTQSAHNLGYVTMREYYQTLQAQGDYTTQMMACSAY